jgi:cytochrome c oxidase assembly protein subunit 15
MTHILSAPNVITPSLAPTRTQDAAVRLWLIGVASLVFAMIIVGGATRLTESGLSITEWQPLLGAIPPLSADDWQIAFAKYQLIPQYQTVNKGMSLDAFKVIFWWEWSHRFLGRIIGIAFGLPFLAFWLMGWLRSGRALRLLAVLGLGALQGTIGWYMVKSGLSERIDVSQYRLALHLSVAFLILGALVWLILDLRPARREPRLRTLTAAHRKWGIALAVLIFSQVAIGGFVAGLKAGRAFNTWPLMDGRFIPDGYLSLDPWWANFTETMATVQFNHRMTAYLIVALVIWHAVRVIRTADDERVRLTAWLLAVGVFAQMVLGIWTVVMAVPVSLGVAHQGLAAIVFATAIWHVHALAHEGHVGRG